jgi:hypothetical protein
MPATSKSQQRLMGIAYAVKTGSMSIENVSSEYRDKVKDLVVGMTTKELKDFASTPHEGLPDEAPEKTEEGLAFAASYTSPQGASMPGAGMGKIQLPNLSNGGVGSGDKASGQGDAEEVYKQEKKKRKRLMQMIKTYESFANINESVSFKAKYKLKAVKQEVSFLITYNSGVVQFVPATIKDVDALEGVDATSELQTWLDHKFGKGGFSKNQEGSAGYSFNITDDLIEDSILKYLKV